MEYTSELEHNNDELELACMGKAGKKGGEGKGKKGRGWGDQPWQPARGEDKGEGKGGKNAQ